MDDALAEYQAIEAAYHHVGTTRDFDATVIAKDEEGKVEIVRRHDEQKRHGTEVGFGSGHAGLVVVYAGHMADRVMTSVNAATSSVTATATVTAEQLAADIRDAESSAAE